MKASFQYAVRYDVTAVCQSPLRTGGTDGAADEVLRDADGQPFLQASSIAGVLRHCIQEHDPQMAERLFGSQEHASLLTVSDGVFTEEPQQTLRPRLKIDAEYGCASDGGKFDVRSICAGAKFEFFLLLKTAKKEPKMEEAIVRALAAVHTGLVTFGAQKTNGFGCVSLTVKASVYDMQTEKGLADWLADRRQEKTVSLSDTAWKPQMLEIKVFGSFDSLLIKSGRGNGKEKKEEKINYVALTDTDIPSGKPVLPGSSLKGAIRARVHLIAGALGIPDQEQAIFGASEADGGMSRAGSVIFCDTTISGFRKQKISRIRIDRFTGGVMRKDLLSEEPVCGKAACSIYVPAADACAARLILYALRDLAEGLHNLGSGWAIGRGFADVTAISLNAPDGRSARLQFSPQTEMQDPQSLLREILEGGQTA